MRIAVASGKGGTGKTTVAVNLACYLANQGKRAVYADCDVEEPNGYLFLKPKWKRTYKVLVKNPKVDESRCDFCGECSTICLYNAMAVLSNKVLLFPSLCHSCGGCFYICPQEAISEVGREIGIVKFGSGKGVNVCEGRLNIGEALSPPIIKYLKNTIDTFDYTIIDSPPGTSCPVIESVKGTDYVILVTEPTPFGLNDLKLAVGMVRELNLPFGIVINRCGIGDDRVHTYCYQQGIDILLEIPNDRRIAEVCSEGQLIIEALPDYSIYFETLLQSISKPLSSIGA